MFFVISINMLNPNTKITSNSKAEVPAIISGTPTQPGEWPFIVALFKSQNWPITPLSNVVRSPIPPTEQEQYDDNKDLKIINDCFKDINKCPKNIYYRQFCAGSLISQNYIITAAHCVSDYKQNNIPFGIAIGFSDIKHSNIDWKTRFITQVGPGDIIIHKDYKYDDENLIQNDIALIKVTLPYNIAKHISFTNQSNYYINKNSYLLGWGFDSKIKYYENIYGRLQDKTLRPYNLLLSSPFILIQDNVLGENKKIVINEGATPCMNDSGGPLITYDKYKKRYYLSGIISQVMHDDVIHLSFNCVNPSYYTDVTKYTDWIYKETKNTVNINQGNFCEGFGCDFLPDMVFQ